MIKIDVSLFTHLDDVVEGLAILAVERELPVPDLVDGARLPGERFAALDLAEVPLGVRPAAAHGVHGAARRLQRHLVRRVHECFLPTLGVHSIISLMLGLCHD